MVRGLGLDTINSTEVISRTPTSLIEKLTSQNRITVLKTFTPLGLRDEGGAAAALRHFSGVGSVLLIDQPNRHQLELEYLDGPSLLEFVDSGQDEEAMSIASEVLRRLHQKTGGPQPELTSLRSRFTALFERADQPGASVEFESSAELAENLLREPQNEGVLHGDLHHSNILHSTKRGWLAIDPKGLWGERTFDAVNLLCNPIAHPELVNHPARLQKFIGRICASTQLKPQRMIQFHRVYKALSQCWLDEDHPNTRRP